MSKGLPHLFDPNGMFEIESLSILLNVKSLAAGASKVFPVQLMGTKTIKANRVIGANILKLYMSISIRKRKKKNYTLEKDN